MTTSAPVRNTVAGCCGAGGGTCPDGDAIRTVVARTSAAADVAGLHRPISRSFAADRRVDPEVAQEIRPPRIVLVGRRDLHLLGERRGFVAVAADDLQRHQRDPRRLGARPGLERGAECGRRFVGPAGAAQQLAANQVSEVAQLEIRSGRGDLLQQRQPAIELAHSIEEACRAHARLDRGLRKLDRLLVEVQDLRLLTGGGPAAQPLLLRDDGVGQAEPRLVRAALQRSRE